MLEVENDVVVPVPEDDQVLVRVVYAGVNPVETYIREGQYAKLPDLPYTPGTDAAGDVERVGKNVTTVKVLVSRGVLRLSIDILQEGDRVFVVGSNNSNNSGSYAQFVVLTDI